MAYVYSIQDSQEFSSTTEIELVLPAHDTGDLLIVTMGADSNSTFTNTTTGWTSGNLDNVGTGAGANVVKGQWWWKWAVSGAEENPVITLATGDVCSGFAICVKDAYYNAGSESDFIDVEETNVETATIPYEATSMTTNYPNSLYLLMIHMDGAISAYAPPPLMTLSSRDDAQHGGGVFVTVIEEAGSTGTFRVGGISTDDETVFLKVAIRNANGGRIPCYPSSDSALLVTPLYGTSIYNTGDVVVTNNSSLIGFGVDDPNFVFQDEGGVFTDLTTAATDDTDADVAFPTSEAINDALYIGYSAAPFAGLSFDRAGCTNGAGGVLAKEYWNGSTWASIATKQFGDQTTNFTVAVADRHAMGWSTPPNWVTTTVNGQSAYWVRLRITTVYATNPTISRIRICTKKVVGYDALGAGADTGIIPFHSSMACSPVTGNMIQGGPWTFGTTVDASAADQFFLGTFLYSTPRTAFNAGQVVQDAGNFFIIQDSTPVSKAWRVGSNFDGYFANDTRNVYAVQLTQSSDTSWAEENGTLDETDIKYHFVASCAPFGVATLYWNMLWLAYRMTLNGGTSDNPFSFDEAMAASNNLIMPVYWKGFYNMPIKLGGDKAVFCRFENFSLIFPTVAVDGGTLIHVDTGILGIIIDAQSGDSIEILNGLISSSSKIQFTIESTASASATYDFSGLAIINAIVTLRDVTTTGFSGMSFISCDEITLNGADVADSTISNTTATANQGAIALTSATEADGIDRISFVDNNDGDLGHSIRITTAGTYIFDGHTFSGGGSAEQSFTTGSGVNSGSDIITTDDIHGYSDGDGVYYQDQGGSVSVGLTDGNLYYVHVQSTTTLSFHTTKEEAIADTGRVDLTSSGSETHYIYSAKADVYNNSGGSVTINIINAGDTPTIRNSNGSSTTINNSVTLTISGVTTGSEPTNYVRCRIEARLGGDLPAGTEIMNEYADSGPDGDGNYYATTTFNYTSDQPVTIRARYKGYIPFETTGTITASGLTVTAVWLTDPNFT